MASLERGLGVRLFRRDVHPVTPTDAGRAVVQTARCDVGITSHPVPAALASAPVGTVDFVFVGPPGTDVGPVEPPVRLPLSLVYRPDDLSPAAAEFVASSGAG